MRYHVIRVYTHGTQHASLRTVHRSEAGALRMMRVAMSLPRTLLALLVPAGRSS